VRQCPCVRLAAESKSKSVRSVRALACRTLKGSDQPGNSSRVRAEGNADDQPGREQNVCGPVGDDPDGCECWRRWHRAMGTGIEPLSPGIKGGLADVLGRTEGGDGLPGRPKEASIRIRFSPFEACWWWSKSVAPKRGSCFESGRKVPLRRG